MTRQPLFNFSRLAIGCLVATLVLSAASPSPAQTPPANVGVVCNVKVLSDKVPDVSSLEAWKKSFIKEDAKDQDKAIAIWNSLVAFVHEDSPPMEFLNWENTVNDPIKVFNVYGYDMCDDTAAMLIGLARYTGFKAQGWSIVGHCVADVWYDDAWHYFDGSFIEYFPKADGKLASVDEVFESVKKWYDENPDYKGDANRDKRMQFMRNEGWKKGPEVMRNCPTYDRNGWLPAKTHGWYSTLREFDGRAKGNSETGYSNGYRLNVQLRRGETLVRNWSNKGLQVNMLGGKDANPANCLSKKTGEDDLCYTPKWGDLAPGRIGNGTLVYAPPIASLKTNALAFENLDLLYPNMPNGVPLLNLKDPRRPGTLVIDMPSSYVYLGGELTVDPIIGNGSSITVSVSDNNGLDWKEVAKIDKAGPQTIDLKRFVARRYDYRLRLDFVMSGLKFLKITHDIQHSQRALPALGQGANTITFSAGPDEGTVTLEGSTTAANKDMQLTLNDFHPTMEGVEVESGLKMTAGAGQITFPIATPGEMTAIRVGMFFRARAKGDAWDVEASFDEGQSWKKITRVTGAAKFDGAYAVLTDVPKGSTKALVRLSGKQRDTLMIFNLRIDTDYKQPAGGFAPVQVTYTWDEGGKEKTDVHVAKKPNEVYTITCGEKPVMKSLTVELAP